MNYTYQCDTVGILPAVYVFTGEGPGFDSPDHAVQAYIDALNAGDVPTMLSTFESLEPGK